MPSRFDIVRAKCLSRFSLLLIWWQTKRIREITETVLRPPSWYLWYCWMFKNSSYPSLWCPAGFITFFQRVLIPILACFLIDKKNIQLFDYFSYDKTPTYRNPATLQQLLDHLSSPIYTDTQSSLSRQSIHSFAAVVAAVAASEEDQKNVRLFWRGFVVLTA